jgi:hypothetical protein
MKNEHIPHNPYPVKPPPNMPPCRKESLEAENARLKAELEWLKEFCTISITPNRELKAQVERLTKAGDNLVYVVTEHPVAEPFVKAWFAAKEGKQP